MKGQEEERERGKEGRTPTIGSASPISTAAAVSNTLHAFTTVACGGDVRRQQRRPGRSKRLDPAACHGGRGRSESLPVKHGSGVGALAALDESESSLAQVTSDDAPI